MIEKLSFETTQGEYEGKKFDIKSHTSPFDMQVKINELVDAVNSIVSVQEKLIDSRFVVETKHEEPAENVQDDHYWFKQQERYKAALVLIRDLTGAGMSYHDIVVEMREIARWALDPHYKPLLIGRYNKEASELLDVLRETKGGNNE